jgi:hypothetical protein
MSTFSTEATQTGFAVQGAARRLHGLHDRQGDKVANIRLHEANLPRLGDREAGFSGADDWPEIDSLVFSASVENADNAYDDGEVPGSFLRLIPLSTLTRGAPLHLSGRCWRLSKAGRSLKTKVESIALARTGRSQAIGTLVSHNDDGSSEFFRVVLTIQPTLPR